MRHFMRHPRVRWFCAILVWSGLAFGDLPKQLDRSETCNARYRGPSLDKNAGSDCWQFGFLPSPNFENPQTTFDPSQTKQRQLLDQALASLAPRIPAKINLYLLAVAGDGTQEVFRREVEFVRDQFARRFGTQARTIALINSRTTLDTVPMATVNNIGESLKAISMAMDKERDILFVYLTSHGSREHELFLSHVNKQLRSLPARELAVLLKDSGIRWKVIVVSACFSGGFIDPLKDDRTLIITAARHDRASFGCADENIFTRFGEAYFKDALPQSASFQEAFTKARVVIEKQESPSVGDSASLPQMYNPILIEQYLKSWWAQARN
jgi:hypothetical protein